MKKGLTQENLERNFKEFKKGYYKDNVENRKAGRVGQRFGGRGDMKFGLKTSPPTQEFLTKKSDNYLYDRHADLMNVYTKLDDEVHILRKKYINAQGDIGGLDRIQKKTDQIKKEMKRLESHIDAYSEALQER